MHKDHPYLLANKKLIRNPLLRSVVYAIGWLSVILGIIGAALPVMPTVPFLILAASCFLRSSPKLFNYLVSHPRWGQPIVCYLAGMGIAPKTKAYALTLMWTGMLFSAFVLLDKTLVKIILPIVGALVSIYILRQPNFDKSQLEKEKGSDSLF